MSDKDKITTEADALCLAKEQHGKASEYNVNTANISIVGSKTKLFIKRVFGKLIRIFWGWYIVPSKERQTKYNEYMHSATGLLISIAEEQRGIIDGLKDSVLDKDKRISAFETELVLQKMLNEKMSTELFVCKQENKKISELLTKYGVDLKVLIDSVKAKGENNCSHDSKYFNYMLRKLNITYDPSLIEDDLVDYFDFEDKYRGTRESIKQRQHQYLEYLKTDNTDGVVLELGCGRGEILEMLRENDIDCIGVDCYPPFVEFCEKQGFSVTEGDALTYLTACEDNSLNGIVLSQVAEHINTDYLYQLIKTGYKKLKNNCCFIIETPNPESLATFLNFNLDGSHIKPVHYLSLDYIFKSYGYSETIRLSNEYSEHPYSRDMQTALIDNCCDEEQKQFYSKLKNILFGATDLTIVAKK